MIGFWKYFFVSSMLFVVMLVKKLIVYPNYFAALVGVADSAGDTVIVINFACAVTVLWAKFAIFTFFGELTKSEQQVVYQRGWLFLCNSLLYWGTLNHRIYVNPYNLGVCMLTVLVLLTLHWICMARVRGLQAVDESDWPWRKVFQVSRLAALCTTLLMLDIVMCVVAVERFKEQNYTLVLFAFFLIDLLEMGIVFEGELVINLMSLKFLHDHPEEEDWDPAKLAIQLARLLGSMIAMIAHSVLIYAFGLRTSDSWSLVGRLIRLTRNVSGLSKVLSASSEVNKHTVSAVEADLARDNTCVICRDEMTLKHGLTAQKTPKKLHCGHVMHAKCLTSWMAQSETCPTCRRTVRTPTVRSTAQGNQTPANGEPGQRRDWHFAVRLGWPQRWFRRPVRLEQQLQNRQRPPPAERVQQPIQPQRSPYMQPEHTQPLHLRPLRVPLPKPPMRNVYQQHIREYNESVHLFRQLQNPENSQSIQQSHSVLGILASSLSNPLNDDPPVPVQMVERGKGVIGGRYEFFVENDP